MCLHAKNDFIKQAGTNIGTEGTKYVCELLAVNTNVTKLCLYYDHIKREGVKMVTELLKVNTSLTWLDLTWI